MGLAEARAVTARQRRLVKARARAAAWERVCAWLGVLAVDTPGMDDPEAIEALRSVVMPAVETSARKCRMRAEKFARKVEG